MTITVLVYTILKSLGGYILLMVVTRAIGRKAISQMTFFDFAVAITLGSVTAILCIGKNTSSPVAAVVLISLGALAILTGFLSQKSEAFRKIVNSEPVVVIQNGEIVEENMKKTRITINELTSQLRENKTFNIADVEFAIMENDGKLSVLKKSQKEPVTPADLKISTSYIGLTKDIIIDGNIMNENLKDVNLNKKWLMDQLKSKGINNVEDVFFAALDSKGDLYVSKGIEGEEREGMHGIE